MFQQSLRPSLISVAKVAVAVAVALLTVLWSGSVAVARTPLPPLASIAETPIASSPLPSQDSCSIDQYANTALPSLYRLKLRGFILDVIGPVSWTCLIVDANGSGASILISSTRSLANGARGSIILGVNANTSDGGYNFCPYTRFFPPSVGNCEGHSARPHGQGARYLHGSATSTSVVVLVADPSGVRTPSSRLATAPTMTVLAASRRTGAFEMMCTIGTALSPLCMTDAVRFAAAFERLNEVRSRTIAAQRLIASP